MASEKEKMLAGEYYDPGDAELSQGSVDAQNFMREYNQTTREDSDVRRKLLDENLGSVGKGSVVRAPFFVDYGYNIYIGDGVFFNFGCVFLDICRVEIGNKTQVGPGVQFYGADHPRGEEERAQGLEFGQPITVGENVWIGGHAIILPGVTIGDGAIVGAGSVVTKDVPKGATVAGNPARVISPKS